jgi:small conductance mechanosensitive channel
MDVTMNAILLAQFPRTLAGLFDQSAWEATWQQIALHVPQIVTGLLLVFIFATVAKIARNIVIRIGSNRSVHADALYVLADTIKWSVLAVGLITGLGTIGIDVSALVAGLGLTGLALGIALKDVVSNSIAGIMILIYKPFHRQDRIAVMGLEGTVVQIDLRFTTLEMEDRRILIPNSNLLTNSIVVYRKSSPSPLEGHTD